MRQPHDVRLSSPWYDGIPINDNIYAHQDGVPVLLDVHRGGTGALGGLDELRERCGVGAARATEAHVARRSVRTL